MGWVNGGDGIRTSPSSLSPPEMIVLASRLWGCCVGVADTVRDRDRVRALASKGSVERIAGREGKE